MTQPSRAGDAGGRWRPVCWRTTARSASVIGKGEKRGEKRSPGVPAGLGTTERSEEMGIVEGSQDRESGRAPPGGSSNRHDRPPSRGRHAVLRARVARAAPHTSVRPRLFIRPFLPLGRGGAPGLSLGGTGRNKGSHRGYHRARARWSGGAERRLLPFSRPTAARGPVFHFSRPRRHPRHPRPAFLRRPALTISRARVNSCNNASGQELVAGDSLRHGSVGRGGTVESAALSGGHTWESHGCSGRC